MNATARLACVGSLANSEPAKSSGRGPALPKLVHISISRPATVLRGTWATLSMVLATA
eukprot:CAMPEP_0182591786 /NCGR_PEP_ID=MMETSP1324-20130603/74585_1 /TAXON_ID=236786 /ORGANISM="Florenciella sp., Strain RCC1587" /LENGTH=57 /DNA_ID=CAMNT_0024809119 /DNA_START=113 /DNA_END=283 /DNA_ORIENTATION=+